LLAVIQWSIFKKCVSRIACVLTARVELTWMLRASISMIGWTYLVVRAE